MDSISEVVSACEPDERSHDRAMRLVRARLRANPDAVAGAWSPTGDNRDLTIALADIAIHYARFYAEYLALKHGDVFGPDSPDYNPDDFDAVVESYLEDYAAFQREGNLKRWR